NNPGFSPATGHFTQVVWKSTTQVACAMVNCGPGTIFPQASTYTVCRYTPPGNIQGQFPYVLTFIIQKCLINRKSSFQTKCGKATLLRCINSTSS
ncbi:hypothetical protein K443DRAFT_104102, partial [Laccaria amethystina LaAM-08-1]